MRGFNCCSGLLCLATAVLGSGCSSDASPDSTDESMDSPGAGGTESGGAGDISGTAGMVSNGSSGAAGAGASGKSGGSGQGGATGSGGAGNIGTGGHGGATTGSGGQAGAGGSAVNIPHTTGKCDGLAGGAVGENHAAQHQSGSAVHRPDHRARRSADLGNDLHDDRPKWRVQIHRLRRHLDQDQHGSKRSPARHGKCLERGHRSGRVEDALRAHRLWHVGTLEIDERWCRLGSILPSGTGMPGFVARVTLDPTNHLHVFVNFHDNCTGGHTALCFGESKDGGATWKVLDFPTSIKNGWGEGTALMPLDEKRWISSSGSSITPAMRERRGPRRATARRSRERIFARRTAPTTSGRPMAF